MAFLDSSRIVAVVATTRNGYSHACGNGITWRSAIRTVNKAKGAINPAKDDDLACECIRSRFMAGNSVPQLSRSRNRSE